VDADQARALRDQEVAPRGGIVHIRGDERLLQHVGLALMIRHPACEVSAIKARIVLLDTKLADTGGLLVEKCRIAQR
jgi:hypothetical protein